MMKLNTAQAAKKGVQRKSMWNTCIHTKIYTSSPSIE